jgi:Holliday junction resolvasome RuvABC endonuclease subunit
MHYIGIDPGKSGGACLMNRQKHIIDVVKFNDKTEADISEIIEEWGTYEDVTCTLEKVNAMPKQGVSSTFKFGVSYGFLQGLLTAHKIPYRLVTPQTWMKHLHCQTKGDKNVTKAEAQRLYPQQKITHAIADAMLIARYTAEVN